MGEVAGDGIKVARREDDRGAAVWDLVQSIHAFLLNPESLTLNTSSEPRLSVILFRSLWV